MDAWYSQQIHRERFDDCVGILYLIDGRHFAGPEG